MYYSSISFHKMMETQPTFDFFADESYHEYAGMFFIAIGQLLVLASVFRLGITGTYLGDYCGITMSERVVGFPFNLTDNPMYSCYNQHLVSVVCFVDYFKSDVV
jgi:phosphatidylethanolamine N-methyltransferase